MPLSLWKRILDGKLNCIQDVEPIDPNAPDMVDVYVAQTRSIWEKVRWILSFVVWVFSAALLFRRAVKSRKITSETTAATTGG